MEANFLSTNTWMFDVGTGSWWNCLGVALNTNAVKYEKSDSSMRCSYNKPLTHILHYWFSLPHRSYEINTSLFLGGKIIGLFHRAISQSGHPLLTITKPGSARKTAWEFANLVDCRDNITKSEQLLQCLQNLPVKTLIERWAYLRVRADQKRKHAFINFIKAIRLFLFLLR